MAVALVAALSLAPSAQARSCSSFRAGAVDYFSAFRASGTSCDRARALLSRAILSSSRKGASSWSYGGWSWRLKSRDEMSARVSGASGVKRISAVWSKS